MNREPEYVRYNQKVLERRRSPYQEIVIAEDPKTGRLLYLDDDLQIGDHDEPYNQALIGPLHENGCLDRVLILGGGDGGALKAALEHEAGKVVLIDIDAEVIELAKRYLPHLCGNAFDHPRAEVVIGDAFARLDKPEQWDGIVYDLTMEPVGADQGRTAFIREILGKIARRLRPGGMLTMQCCGADETHLRDEIRAGLDRAFPEWGDWRTAVPSYDVEWVFAWARTAREE